jgi:ABC-type molybdate transport system substrate-binding protein
LSGTEKLCETLGERQDLRKGSTRGRGDRHVAAELQLTTLYSAAVTASARQPEAAMSLIRVLTVPTAAPIFKAAGLDPAL